MPDSSTPLLAENPDIQIDDTEEAFEDSSYFETEMVFTASGSSNDSIDQESYIENCVEEEIKETERVTSDDAAIILESQEDKQAEEQVELLKSKLEASQKRRASNPINIKLMRIKQILHETKALNKESETYNTQSAVLLSALNALKSDLQNSESDRESISLEMRDLINESKETINELADCKLQSQQENSLSSKNNSMARELIANLEQLIEQQKERRDQTTAQLKQTEANLSSTSEQLVDLEQNCTEINELTNSAKSLVEQTSTENAASLSKAKELDKAILETNKSKAEIDSLKESLENLKSSLERQQSQQSLILEKSGAQALKTEKLNEQQITLLDLTQSRHEELRQELESTVALNKKYENKLQQTESKLKDALEMQSRFKNQYDEAQEKLDSNESLLKTAAKTVSETSSQNSKFNAAVNKFQHSTEQSQHLIIRTQATLENVLSRNELLERENKILNQRINEASKAKSPSNYQTQSSNTSKPLNAASNLDTLAFNSSAVSSSSLAQASHYGDNHSPNAHPITRRHDSSQGTFRLMMFLAVALPLGFIAYSMFNSSHASEHEIRQLEQSNISTQIEGNY